MERAQWRSVYENTAYDQLPWFDPGPSRGVRLAVEAGFLPARGELLDVGCGAGSNLIFLAGKGLTVHGVDLSPVAVDVARARAREAGREVDVREGDVLALPFADGGFDAAVDNGCFHALPLSRRERYAKEMCRVLKPEGRFVLSWVAREHTGPRGPRHRPSLLEVTKLLESRFLFFRTGFLAGDEEEGPAAYYAFLTRRSAPYPPQR